MKYRYEMLGKHADGRPRHIHFEHWFKSETKCISEAKSHAKETGNIEMLRIFNDDGRLLYTFQARADSWVKIQDAIRADKEWRTNVLGLKS